MTRESRRRSSPQEIRYYFFNFKVKLFGHEKLQSKWKGPFDVVSSSSHGAVTLRNKEGTLFKVNGQRLKIFLEPNNELEEVDSLAFVLRGI